MQPASTEGRVPGWDCRHRSPGSAEVERKATLSFRRHGTALGKTPWWDCRRGRNRRDPEAGQRGGNSLYHPPS